MSLTYQLTRYIIIITPKRRALLVIGPLQTSSQQPVLYCPYPTTSRNLHQVVAAPHMGPTNAVFLGTRLPLNNFWPRRPSFLRSLHHFSRPYRWALLFYGSLHFWSDPAVHSPLHCSLSDFFARLLVSKRNFVIGTILGKYVQCKCGFQ